MDQEITPLSNFILYTDPNGDVKLRVLVQDETIWLTQDQMAELFDKARNTITEHIQNVFEEWELDEKVVCRDFRRTTPHGAIAGKTQETSVKHYNLDVIISVGYRVKSNRGTQFRIWSTQILREYIVKGFVLDDERLKQGKATFEKDYFRELLERVRSIRASERRIYLQLTDIFSECSRDYDKDSKTTHDFFAEVQNKFHFAIIGQTAAERIHSHVDRNKDHMGLSTWKHSPNGRIISSDTTVAKNYLTEEEIRKLERTISAFFDYIEHIIENRQSFTMAEFIGSVNKFLAFNEYKILDGKWKISMDTAKKKALDEYKEFNKTQKIESDFEKSVKKMLKSSEDAI